MTHNDGEVNSIVDGERVDWEKGDLVLLPLREKGVEHQHFNLDPKKPSKWAAFINIPIIEHLASVLEQKEASPDFKGDKSIAKKVKEFQKSHSIGDVKDASLINYDNWLSQKWGLEA